MATAMAAVAGAAETALGTGVAKAAVMVLARECSAKAAAAMALATGKVVAAVAAVAKGWATDMAAAALVMEGAGADRGATVVTPVHCSGGSAGIWARSDSCSPRRGSYGPSSSTCQWRR